MKLRLISALVVTEGILWGQQPTFEAASIKLSDPGRRGGGINIAPARLRVFNAPFTFCVQVAWNVKDFQVSGANGWMQNEHYDIDAVAAAPFKGEEYRAMLQALLTDRFGLAIHKIMQEKPAYVLVVGKNGAKLPPPIESQNFMFSRTPSGDITLDATSASMNTLAQALSNRLGVKIIDQTGLEGKFNVSMQYTPDPTTEQPGMKGEGPLEPRAPDAPAGPSIFHVLQDKFGLKLEARKVPGEVIVIDGAHRPAES